MVTGVLELAGIFSAMPKASEIAHNSASRIILQYQLVHNDWLRDGIDWERHQRQEGLPDENRTQSHDRQLNEGKKVREQLIRALLSQLS